MKTIQTILIALVLSSCSTAYHCRKCIDNGQPKADTIYRDIFIELPASKADSIFVSKPGDTVTIHKDRLVIKYVKLPKDSVFIQGECEADTVKINVPTLVENRIEVGLKPMRVRLIAIGCSLLALVVGYALRAVFK